MEILKLFHRFFCAGVVLFSISGFFMSSLAKASEPIRVGASDATSTAGIFLASEKGYFKEQGLDVQISIIKASGAPMTALLVGGDLEVGAGNITSGVFAAHGKVKLVADKGMVLSTTSYMQLLVRSDHLRSGRYKSLKDLKGFTMAVTSLSGVSQLILTERFLKAGGLKLSDVHMVKMTYSEMNAALRTKSIDACVQLEPYLTEAVEAGFAKNVLSADKVYPGQPSAAIIFSQKFLSSRRNDAVKFLAAYLKGVRDYLAAFQKGKGKGEAISMLKKYINIDSDALWNKMVPAGLNPNGFISKENLKNDMIWYKEHGDLKSVPDIDTVVDESALKAALEIVGKAN